MLRVLTCFGQGEELLDEGYKRWPKELPVRFYQAHIHLIRAHAMSYSFSWHGELQTRLVTA